MTSYRYVPDGKGGMQAVALPSSADVQVDAPGPLPSPERLLQVAVVNAQLAKQDAGPATPADALLDSMRAQGIVADAVATVATDVKGYVVPPTQQEYDQRVNAAARLAAALDMQLVWVVDDPALKVPGHLEVRQFGMPYMAGPLEAIESRLAIDAKQRAASNRAVALLEDQAAERARIQAEALANSPAARLARLEAKLAAAGLPVD